MQKVAVVYCGQTKFGIRNATWKELVQECGKAVFDDAKNIDKKEIDSLFVGTAMPERFAFQSHTAPMVAELLGLTPTKVIARTELACSSGQSAIRFAYACISSGLSEIALCLGVEKMNLPNMAEAQSSMACVLDREFDGVHGASAPPFFALCSQRHMKEYGTKIEQMAMVSVKNHKFSSKNPYAHFQKELSVEKILNSPMVSPPLRLFDCSGITDGASAVILTTEEKAKKLTDNYAEIIGSGQCAIGNNIANLKSLTTWYPLIYASRTAYKSAKLTPKEIDIAEIHDCFTISEIIEYEDMGFCEKGKGGKFIEDGQSEIGGKIAVNTRGGLLGCGHPLGATGISQVVEILQQFRGSAFNQVKNAEIGITHNLSGDANVHSLFVFRKK